MKLDDLKARLQSHMGKQDVDILLADCREAATAITDLEALVGELGEALEEAVDVFDGMCDDEINEELMPRLRATLAKLEKARG